MFDSSKIRVIIVAILAAFIAVYLGITAATAQLETIAWVVGTAALTTCLLLGRRIWLLIPFMAAMELSVRLPGLPSTLLVAQVAVVAFSVLLLMMRQLPFRLRWTELEMCCLILTLFVVQVYLRNPVGLNIFGGTSVGGKPYALFAISLISAALLAGQQVPPGELKTALRLSILGGMINLVASSIGRFVPTVGFWTGANYVDTSITDYTKVGQAVDTGAADRQIELLYFGRNLSLWISSFKSPLRACLHPLWGSLVILSFVAATVSGFRNAVAMVALTYFVGLCYRGGFMAILTSTALGAAAITVLALSNLIMPLPPNIQRSLSFLPGTWEQRYLDDAKSSTDWRYEIWVEVLTSDRWIQNKWWGDGLGFTARELAYQATLKDGGGSIKGISGFDNHRESILASGDYHSGPVQMVRIIGYVGLMFVILFQIRLGVRAHRQIMRCRGSEWFPLALFTGIPLIWNPVFFLFIFGDFKSATATLLLGSAMVRMLENNLPLPAWSRLTKVPYLLNPAKNELRVQNSR